MKHAFTLAEVLITLGIIGIVAAMTLPALIANHQKNVTIAQLQKVYTILNQALNLSQLQNGEYKYWEDSLNLGAEKYFEIYFKPYFKDPKICKTYKECGYKSITPWTARINSTDKTSTLTCVNLPLRVSIILTDGTFVAISTAAGTTDIKDNNIYVDLNGPKNPNRYGRDFFQFTRTEKNGVQPYGYDLEKSEIDRRCASSGTTCAAKIIGDSWQIKDDYPYF